MQAEYTFNLHLMHTLKEEKNFIFPIIFEAISLQFHEGNTDSKVIIPSFFLEKHSFQTSYLFTQLTLKRTKP